jgi:hypothetical protein
MSDYRLVNWNRGAAACPVCNVETEQGACGDGWHNREESILYTCITCDGSAKWTRRSCAHMLVTGVVGVVFTLPQPPREVEQ